MKTWVFGVLALVIGFGVGWLAFRPKASAPTPVYVFQKNNDDNADPDVDPQEANISYGDGVIWRHRGKKAKDAHIEFQEEVFSGMTQVQVGSQTRWAVSNCQGRGCFSGWAKKSGRFKYWQIVHDPTNPNPNERKEKDGWIVIDRGP